MIHSRRPKQNLLSHSTNRKRRTGKNDGNQETIVREDKIKEENLSFNIQQIFNASLHSINFPHQTHDRAMPSLMIFHDNPSRSNSPSTLKHSNTYREFLRHKNFLQQNMNIK